MDCKRVSVSEKVELNRSRSDIFYLPDVYSRKEVYPQSRRSFYPNISNVFSECKKISKHNFAVQHMSENAQF